MKNNQNKSSLNLKIEIDKNSGFCFGVVNAINKAEQSLKEYGKIYCLGEIVHNEEEIHRLEKQGLITISGGKIRDLQEEKILFRAHGEPPESYKNARQNKNFIIDASCPIILKLQKSIKESFNKGENILIFGEKNHPEIVGLDGQIENTALVFESIEELDFEKLPNSFSLYSQTTKDIEEFFSIANHLKSKGYKVKVYNTICDQVSNRKNTIKDFSRRFDKVVLIAGKNSSNGKVLLNASREVNPNTFHIATPNELDSKWFSKNNTVGICGATSTPMWLMEKVKSLLESF